MERIYLTVAILNKKKRWKLKNCSCFPFVYKVHVFKKKSQKTVIEKAEKARWSWPSLVLLIT